MRSLVFSKILFNKISRTKVFSGLLLVSIVSFISGCTFVSGQIEAGGNYLGRQVGLVGAETDYSRDDQRQQALKTISPEQEYHIGRAVAARIFQHFPAATSSELQKYVQLVGHSLVISDGAGSPFGGYHFKVVESEQLNAISAPGGYIFITTGFLRSLQNEDQLAAILAHEIVHISERHGLRTVKDKDLLAEISGLGLASGGLSCVEALAQATVVFSHLVDGMIDTLLESGYSQEFEYQADSGAYARLNKSGYQPQAIYGALSAIDEALKKQDVQSGGWFTTHPSVSERVSKLQSQAIEQISGLSPTGFEARTMRAQLFLKGM